MKSKNGIKKYSKQLLRFCVKLVVVLLLFALHSCEKVEKPYLPFTPPPPTSDTIRKILVEDYTGHTCLNCPRAAKVLHSLESKLYPHQIIGLAVHGTGFALPNSNYPEDFRTAVGNTYLVDFGIGALGLPMGMVNRKKKGSSYGIGDAEWKNAIDTIVNKAPNVYIEISNSYDNSTRKLNSEVKCTFLTSLTGNYNLVLLFTEDSIIAPQLDGNTKIDDYVHMHLLRAAISDPYGIQVVTGAVSKGFVKTQSFSYDVPQEFDYNKADVYPALIPNIKYCGVVAFIYNQATKEIIQAEKAKVK